MGSAKSPEAVKVEPRRLAPGVLLCVAIAVASFISWLWYKPISSLMWAFIYSIILTNLTKLPRRYVPGVNYSARELLRGAIAALGIVVSALVWIEVGVGVANALIVIFFSYFFGVWLGRKTGLSSALSSLIGVGTSICGASAIAAISPAIGAKEEETGMALACITLFGLLAMFAYPFLFTATMVGEWLAHNLNAYAVWVGSGVHETAQVAAAAGAVDPAVIGSALLVKSIRIFMIGPMIVLATYFFGKMRSSTVPTGQRKATQTGKVVLPTYAVLFIANTVVAAFLDYYAGPLQTLGFDWIPVKKALSGTILPFLLAASFAGVGLKVRFRDISKLGGKAFGVGALVAVVAGLLALLLAIIVQPLIPAA